MSLRCKYSKPATTSLVHTGSKSAKEVKSNSTSTKWTKPSRLQTFFSTPNGRKSKDEYSIMIAYGSLENPRNSITFLWPFALFKSAASFTKRACESIDSPFIFFWQLFHIFLRICQRIRIQMYRYPTSSLFQTVSTQTSVSLDLFSAFLSA